MGPGDVRMLATDLALWQATLEIDPGGGAKPIRGYAVDVMRRVGDSWKIVETHPKVFPPPTREAEAAIPR
jgi:hypothetical protein